jgi:acyl carrier protein
MDKLKLFNEVEKIANPYFLNFTPIKTLDIKFKDTGLDSLETFLVVAYFCEIYGVEDEISKQFTPETPQDVYDFMDKHKTKEPKSIEDALSEFI